MKLREILDRFVFTRKCPSCGALLDYERRNEAFCSDCKLKWNVLKTRECKRCGRSMCECICMTSTLSKAGALCHHKIVKYSSDIPVIHNTMMFIKRNNNPRISGFLAEQIRSVLAADKDLPCLDADRAIITYVPRGERAVIKYGVDQSENIAGSLSEIMSLPFVRSLERVKGGKEQKKLNATQRAKNAKKLFRLCDGVSDGIDGKHVILIDDIVTTGASMAACVALLIKAGARAVICVSVASTENSK